MAKSLSAELRFNGNQTDAEIFALCGRRKAYAVYIRGSTGYFDLIHQYGWCVLFVYCSCYAC